LPPQSIDCGTLAARDIKGASTSLEEDVDEAAAEIDKPIGKPIY
jgi:hypothetical protein